MGPSRALVFASAISLAACGGILGFGSDDEPTPVEPTSDGGAGDGTTASGSTDVEGADPSKDSGGSVDADLGDVVIVVPPVDAAVDSPAADDLFPRLATFESGSLTGANGADVNDGMSLLASNALKGTYSAQTKNASTSVGFSFVAKATNEIYAFFGFRFDAMPANQMPAAFFRLALAGGGNIAAAAQSNGDIFVVVGGTATKLANVTQGTVYRFGIHARVSPPTIEAAIVPDGPFTGASPVIVAWPSPATIVASSVGELSGAALRITVDQIAFNQTGFDK